VSIYLDPGGRDQQDLGTRGSQAARHPDDPSTAATKNLAAEHALPVVGEAVMRGALVGSAYYRRCHREVLVVQVFLETERLVLRRFTMADADNLVDLDSDPEVMHFITGGRPTCREDIVARVLPAFLGYYERFAEYGFWAAMEKSTGEFLGWFHFRPRDGSLRDQPELGYRLCTRRRAASWRRRA
jgi:Acetyltransferase (GNAT) domain